MRRTALVLSVAFALVAVAAVPIGGLAVAGDADVAAQQTTDEQTDNRTDADVAPGERLSGVLGVGGAELDTEVDSRAFGLQVAEAASNESARADVVADQLGDIEERLADLEQRKAALDRARENGSMSEGAYAARLATVAAEIEGTERLANESANATAGLPAAVLEEKGINASAIQTLQDRANELGGQEVAEIARSIGGNSVGKAPDHAGPDQRGPPEQAPDQRDGEDGDVTATPDAGPDGQDRAGNGTERPGTATDVPEDGTERTGATGSSGSAGSSNSGAGSAGGAGGAP